MKAYFGRWQLQRRWILLIPAVLSLLLGLGFGSAFLWAAQRRAWEFFTAGMLWMLIASSSATLMYALQMRVIKGDWVRGLRIGLSTFCLAATVFLLAVAVVSSFAPSDVSDPLLPQRPNLLQAVLMTYGTSLLMALMTGPAYALTSPFRTFSDK